MSVTVVSADGGVFDTAEAPATVNESAIAEPVTVSLNVSSIVLSAVLAAVNVGTPALAVPANNPKMTKAISIVNIIFFFILLFSIKVIFRKLHEMTIYLIISHVPAHLPINHPRFIGFCKTSCYNINIST